MDLRTFFESFDMQTREELAQQAGTKWVYISQILRKNRQPSPTLARKLHQVSKGKVPLSSLRPDIWAN